MIKFTIAYLCALVLFVWFQGLPNRDTYEGERFFNQVMTTSIGALVLAMIWACYGVLLVIRR